MVSIIYLTFNRMESYMLLKQPLITFRLQDGRTKNERVNIQLDGVSIGDLGVFEDLQIPVTKGLHLITSNGFWKSKAYPLELEVSENDDIEITLEPVDGKNKFQFFVETKIMPGSLLSKANYTSRRLAWDLGREIFVRKIKNSCLYFDLRNYSYLHPLRFEIDLSNYCMKVFANRLQKIVLYESRVNSIDPLDETDNKPDNLKKHSFYREDGTLLGHLFLENGRWFITSADMQDKLAEICTSNMMGGMFSHQDHYLVSVGSDHKILTYKKWERKNFLHFRNVTNPPAEYQEILMLAFIKFSALSRKYSFLNGIECAPDDVENKSSDFVKSLA